MSSGSSATISGRPTLAKLSIFSLLVIKLIAWWWRKCLPPATDPAVQKFMSEIGTGPITPAVPAAPKPPAAECAFCGKNKAASFEEPMGLYCPRSESGIHHFDAAPAEMPAHHRQVVRLVKSVAPSNWRLTPIARETYGLVQHALAESTAASAGASWESLAAVEKIAWRVLAAHIYNQVALELFSEDAEDETERARR